MATQLAFGAVEHAACTAYLLSLVSYCSSLRSVDALCIQKNFTQTERKCKLICYSMLFDCHTFHDRILINPAQIPGGARSSTMLSLIESIKFKDFTPISRSAARISQLLN